VSRADRPGIRRQRPAVALRVAYATPSDLGRAYETHIRHGFVFVPTTALVPPGTLAKLGVTLPHGRTVDVAGTVEEIFGAGQVTDDAVETGMSIAIADDDAKELCLAISRYLAASVPPAPKPRVPTALVVDDHQRQREAMAKLLSSEGFEVITAANGVEALRAAITHAPDIVLTDVEMPEMDGWNLLRLLRARPALRTTPIVFLTALHSDAERLRAYELGVDDFLAKADVSGAELCSRVRRLMRATAYDRSSDGSMLRGDIAKVSLPTLLSLFEMERRTGVLTVQVEHELATLYIRDGAVVQVDLLPEAGAQTGIERLFHVLDFTSGKFELVANEISHANTVGISTSFALLEHARIRDERK